MYDFFVLLVLREARRIAKRRNFMRDGEEAMCRLLEFTLLFLTLNRVLLLFCQMRVIATFATGSLVSAQYFFRFREFFSVSELFLMLI